MVDRTTFGMFLRSRRDRVRPGDIGLPAGRGARRTQGLRREEVAIAAGVSVDYYARLEQGRERNPSDAVLDALAATLLLEGDERAHLFRMAEHSSNRKHACPSSHAPHQKVPTPVRHILETLSPAPAYVLNRRNDLLAANSAALALLVGIGQWPQERRNTIRYIFLHPAARKLFVNWDTIATAAVAHLRAMTGLHPNDRALAELVEELTIKSEEFPRMWDRHEVRCLSTGSKAFDHPHVGGMQLTYEILDISRVEQRLIIYHATPETPDHDAMMLLDLLDNKPDYRHSRQQQHDQHVSE